MGKVTGGLFTALLLFGMGVATYGVSRDLMAKKAAEAYSRGAYQQAAGYYQIMVQSGFDGPEVYYDIGNCHLKRGDLGRAVLAYRRALKTAPGFSSARHNLEVARSLLPAKVAAWQPSPWESVLRALPSDALEWLILILAFLGNGALCVVLYLSPGRARRLTVQALLSLFLAAGLLLGVMAYADAVLPAHTPAVVIRSAPVYPGPEKKDDPMAVLPPGSEIIRVSRAGPWSLVLWGEGRGWTQSDAVEVP